MMGSYSLTGTPNVLVFDWQGARLPSLVNPITYSSDGSYALTCDRSSDLIYVCDQSYSSRSPIFAVDMKTGHVRWETEPLLKTCYSLAVLPHAGIVVGCSDGTEQIYAVDMSGSVVSSHYCAESGICRQRQCDQYSVRVIDKGYVEAFRLGHGRALLLRARPHRRVYRFSTTIALAVVPPYEAGDVRI